MPELFPKGKKEYSPDNYGVVVLYYVGCYGWRNVPWKSQFYPATLNPKDYLSYYSRVFNFVEVNLGDGTDDRLSSIAANWHKQTPQDFRFSVRVPWPVAYSQNDSLGDFLEKLAPVEEKVISVLIEVPSSLTLGEGRGWLGETLDSCTYHGYSAAFHFRHSSWFQDLTYSTLKKHGAILVWSDDRPYPVTTSDLLYLRLSANNEPAWIEKIKASGQESVVITLDSPAKASAFLKLVGLPEKEYSASSPPSQPAVVRGWSGRVIMCVDLNAFYPSCEELRDPALKGKPHAVIMTDQQNSITKGVVSSCSYEARKYGVRSAMSLSKAKSLCPDLILRPVDIPYYSSISEQVMAVLEEFADVLEQASIDEAFLDCTKAGTSPEEYGKRIKQAVKDRCGLLCSIGIATTKSAAKIASDFQKPDGLTVVYDLKKFLEPLDVGRVSGIGPKTQQALKEMGIKTLGQLASADVQTLTSRFGKNGYWMWRVANGTDEEPVVPREDHVSLSTEYTLDVFARDRESILGFLDELVDEIHQRAKRRGYWFRTVGVKLVRTDFTMETREVSFDEFRNDRESISSAIGPLLDKFSLSDDRPAVRKVGLKISHLIRDEEIKKEKDSQKTLLDYY